MSEYDNLINANFSDLPPEAVEMILLELPYDSLVRACQINTSLVEFCSDDIFWRRKIRYKLGDDYIELKPEGMNYRSMYLYLMDLEHSFMKTNINIFEQNWRYILSNDYVLHFIASRPKLLNVVAKRLLKFPRVCINVLAKVDTGASPYFPALLSALKRHNSKIGGILRDCALKNGNKTLLHGLLRSGEVAIDSDLVDDIVVSSKYSLLSVLKDLGYDVASDLIQLQAMNQIRRIDLHSAIKSGMIDTTSLRLLAQTGTIAPRIVNNQTITLAERNGYDDEFLDLLETLANE